MAEQGSNLDFSSFADSYENELVPQMFDPHAAELVRRAAPVSSDHILDVACGTGIVARHVFRVCADARVVGVDPNPEMLTIARNAEPRADWRQGPADALPVAEGEEFSLLLCQQGLQFFPDKPAAISEFRRVTGEGARVFIATWWGVETDPYTLALHEVATKHLGDFIDTRHSMGDPDEVAQLLTDGGFAVTSIDSFTNRTAFAPGVYEGFNLMAQMSFAASAGRPATEETVAALQAELAELSQTAGRDGFTLTTNIVSARG